MSAQRYWRLHVTSPSDVAIGEITLATSVGGVQVAVDGTASASAQYLDHDASKAFDYSTTSYWRSGTTSGSSFIQYDLGEGNELDVVEVSLLYADTVGAPHAPRTITLLSSDDEDSWYVVAAWGDILFVDEPGSTVTLSVDVPSSNKALRVLCAKTEMSWHQAPQPEVSACSISAVVHSADPYRPEAHLLESCQYTFEPFNKINRSQLQPDIRNNYAAVYGPPTMKPIHRNNINGVAEHNYPVMRTPWTGPSYISGSTTILGSPAARRVDLIDQRSGLLIKTMSTHEDGHFTFKYLAPGPWTVLGVDNSLKQNSVVFAHITAVGDAYAA